MRSLLRILLGVVCCLNIETKVAFADAEHGIQFRIGDHARFGRLVVPVPDGVVLTSKKTGNSFELVFNVPVVAVGVEGDHGPGIISAQPTAGRLAILLSPGATIRSMWIGRRFVLDVVPSAGKPLSDPRPVAMAPIATESRSVENPVLPGLPAPLVAVVDNPIPAPPTKANLVPTPRPAVIAALPGTPAALTETNDANSAPVSIAASVIPAQDGQAPSLFLPFGPEVGAAAFARGDSIMVVFDTQKPVDLSPIGQDPTFGQARLSLLAAGTMIRIPALRSTGVGVRRVKDGWIVGPPGQAGQSVDPKPVASGMSLLMSATAKVMVIPDPTGGADLLVGTVRQDGQRVETERRAPGYRLVPTILGVVAERLSDQTELRNVGSGFLLRDPLQAISAKEAAAPARFSRVLDQPDVDVPELWRRYKTALAQSALQPPGSRRMPRLDAARAALALGFGKETRRLAIIADQDAPTGPDQPVSAFLAGAGALLESDKNAAALLSDSRIGNSDEAGLWRALAAARVDPADAMAARTIAGRFELLLSYPPDLRRALLGDAALSLAHGGNSTAKTLLAGLDGGGKVGLAKAVLVEGIHRDVAALPQFDRLSTDPDPVVSMKAAQEAIEIRLAAGQLTAAQAAERLASHIYDGRMAGNELDVRLKVSALRAQAHDWNGALSDLRTIGQLFPAAQGMVQQAAEPILRAISDPRPPGRSDASEPQDPLSAVELLENNQDLLPASADRTALSLAMVDRLSALDLPDRAADLLSTALAKSPSATDRARLGLALARLQLEQGDLKAAKTTLDSTDSSELTENLSRQRMIVRGQVLEAGGDHDGALSALATIQDPDALELRARILAAKKDWAGAVPVLTALLSSRASRLADENAVLDPGLEDLVLRLAGAMAQSGQQAALAELNKHWAPRFADTAHRDMLRLLAAPDVKSADDLARSAAEITASRNAFAVLDAHPAAAKP